MHEKPKVEVVLIINNDDLKRKNGKRIKKGGYSDATFCCFSIVLLFVVIVQ